MLIGLLTLPGYRPSYNDQKFIPQDIPGSQGYNAAARHFPESKMTTPDILLIESDHDMRNSADFLILNKLAKAIFAVPGISNVQSVTRPEGKAIDHTSIPYMLSWTQANQQLFLPFQKARMADMLQQAEDMSTMIALMRHMQDLMTQMVQTTHHMVGSTHEPLEAVAEVETTSRISTISSGRSATISTGSRTASTFPFAGRSGRFSMRSTVSTWSPIRWANSW
jgi:RND superfamily putative drug exporter